MAEIKFFGYVKMLDELAETGCLQRDENNKNNLILYCELSSEDKERYGVSESWMSRNIFDVAQELYSNERSRKSLFDTLKENHIEPLFNDDGDFERLEISKFESEREF